MAFRHIIDASGEYIVQDSGNDPMPPLPEGASEVDARPSPFHDRVGDTWVEDTARKTEALSLEVRGMRDFKLRDEVDPIVTNPLRWADLTTAKQNEWTQYRTDLLNVPQQAGFPNTINWPTKPE
jgi:hypothetical protein